MVESIAYKQCDRSMGGKEKKRERNWTKYFLFGVSNKEGEKNQVTTVHGSYSKHFTVWPKYSFRKWWQQIVQRIKIEFSAQLQCLLIVIGVSDCCQFVKFHWNFSRCNDLLQHICFVRSFRFVFRVFRRNSHFYTWMLCIRS